MKENKLIKFLNNQSSPQEHKEMVDWLKRSDAEQALENMLQETWSTSDNTAEEGGERDYARILDKIHGNTLPNKKKIVPRQRWLPMGKIAATYLLLLFSAYFLSQAYKKQDPVIKELIVFEKVTKPGEKLKLTLPDQSTVILNSVSKITFDSDFGKNNRRVTLEGEAYFEIKPDKSSPFVVQTEEVMTTALGTAFNVLSKNKKVIVSLTEGKVKVSYNRKQVEIDPGEMVALSDEKEKELVIGHFDPSIVTAWKEGKIRFKKKSLKNILVDLEDWYGVNFNVGENINLHREVTGLFENNNLEDILNGLSFSLNLNYSINGNNIAIKTGTPMK